MSANLNDVSSWDFWTSHQKISNRLKQQHTDRLFGMCKRPLCYYRENWMDKDRNALVQLQEKCASATINLNRRWYGTGWPDGEYARDLTLKPKKTANVSTSRKIIHPKPIRPFSRKPNQKLEWIGDAVLRLYVRLYLVENNPDAVVGQLNEALIESNAWLGRCAHLFDCEGPNQLEIKIAQAWHENPEKAKEIVNRICKEREMTFECASINQININTPNR